MFWGVKTYKGKIIEIATKYGKGVVSDHVDIFPNDEENPRGSYSCLVRKSFNKEHWISTEKEFDDLLYNEAVEEAKKIAKIKHLPLLLEYDDRLSFRKVVWHPRGWKPKLN